MIHNNLKEKLDLGKQVYGMFLTCPSPEDVEICGVSGFDFCIIDMEHGAITIETCRLMIAASQLHGMTPVVRVPLHMRQSICLDWGAQGIMLPMVRSSEEVSACMQKLKYYPHGDRGIWLGRAANYCVELDPDAYFTQENRETMVMLQIETAQAMENLEKILEENPMVDLAFIGPTDLSQSLGYPAAYHQPEVVKMVKKCIQRIKKSGKKAGIFTNSPEDARHFRELGVDLIAGDMISFVSGKVRNFRLELEGVKQPSMTIM